MGKLLLSMFLVTVYQCYGHYPPRSALRAQGQSAVTLDESVVRNIANNFDWNVVEQYQSTQQSSEPEVVVMVIEYQSDEQIRELLSQHGWRPPHEVRQPPPPPPQPQSPHSTSNRDPMFWYHQTQQTHYGYEKPRLPTRPYIEQQYSQHNVYGNQYFQHQNPGINSGYENFGTNTNQRPSTQYEGNYDNNQNYVGSNQFNENRPVDQKPGYYTPELGNQNQFNQNSQWYPNNINQGVGSDQQNPNNGGLISGTLNPINTISSDEISQFPIKPTPPLIDKEAVAPENSTTGSEMTQPEEEEEDFQIDVRFKAE